ncbi:unnamed protein product [Vitrella brassicaformis CCMP3155]|uniref:Uncharacterized protein n=1 Tax=Vitrella brassicaformis (strain CCMP3155) TaxID=1169540 RepID=A0A0G4F1C9_VITBC|nr:unnamed protein product [Vitrella brassicaformis CCMP3155]|eukprot:CEM05522.1 unnamed protein product [Vitrella brassicaformis CCMP3155]
MAVSHDDPTTRRAAVKHRILAQQIAAQLPTDGQKLAGMEATIKQLVTQLGVSSTSAKFDEAIRIVAAAMAVAHDMALQTNVDIVSDAVADVQETLADSMRDLDSAVNHFDHKHEQLLGGVTHAVVNLTKVAIHQDTHLDAVERKAVQGQARAAPRRADTEGG